MAFWFVFVFACWPDSYLTTHHIHGMLAFSLIFPPPNPYRLLSYWRVTALAGLLHLLVGVFDWLFAHRCLVFSTGEEGGRHPVEFWMEGRDHIHHPFGRGLLALAIDTWLVQSLLRGVEVALPSGEG